MKNHNYDYDRFTYPTMDDLEEEANSAPEGSPSHQHKEDSDDEDDKLLSPDDFTKWIDKTFNRSPESGVSELAAKPTSAAANGHQHPEPSSRTPKTSKRTNAPRGIFLFALKKGEFTWRIQLWSKGDPDRPKIPCVRFQLWNSPEKGGSPVKEGPGRGFTLTILEVERVIKALQDALEKVRSGEFDPNDENNQVPFHPRQGQ